jgi:hypothetical protein
VAPWLLRHGGREDLSASPTDHSLAAKEVAKTLVWGFRSQAIKADVPNAFIAEYVSQHRSTMIGIAAVDPTEADAMERLANIARHSEFGGITLSPAGQGFHPADSCAMKVYAFCAQRKLPVFVETGTDFAPTAVTEFARPHLFDEVARTFPGLTVVLGGVGWPWVEEAVALLAKQPRVYADVACLLRRPWVGYQGLQAAYQCGVAGKLLFGSDFPFSTAAVAMEQLYRINSVVQHTPLPPLPREVLRAIVEREALRELGMD